MAVSTILWTILLLPTIQARNPAIEPYAYLNNGGFTGQPVAASPDPLVAYVWNSTVNATALQVFDTLPVSVVQISGTFQNLDSVLHQGPDGTGCAVEVSNAGQFMVDFGTESAAWIEIDADLSPADAAHLQLGIGEWTEVQKSGIPKAYNGTYRLETNAALYEGVRYGFVSFTATPSKPFTITGLRAVSQAKPVNYVGAFSSPDSLLTIIWYTSIYTVRLNLEQDYIGAILVDRGDRIAWIGDLHVAQAASLAAFGNSQFVLHNLNLTATNCNNIESYCIYWVLSLVDYWRFTGDNVTLLSYASNVASKLEHAHSEFSNYALGLSFFGWDDRLGSGFANASALESQYDYRFLVLRTYSDWVDVMTVLGQTSTADHFNAYFTADSAALRSRLGGANWWSVLGVHSAAEALNVPGFASPANSQGILTTTLNNIVNICSLSNFNQYWILQALGNAGAMDKAIASIHHCWGSEIAMGATAFWEISSPEWVIPFRPNYPVPYGENGPTSLCHPWSAGPAPWLSKQVLGVSVSRAAGGRMAIIVAPFLTRDMAAGGGLRGAVPTSCGPVEVEIVVTAGAVSAGAAGTAAGVASSAAGSGVASSAGGSGGAAPRGFIRLFNPASSTCAATASLLLSEVLLVRMHWVVLSLDEGVWVSINSTATATSTTVASTSTSTLLLSADPDSPPGPHFDEQQQQHRRSRVARIELPPGHTTVSLLRHHSSQASTTSPVASGAHIRGASMLRDVAPGAHSQSSSLSASSQPSSSSPFPPESWPGRLIAIDTWTQGTWLGKYGAAGHVLYSFGGGAGTDVKALPPWVASVTKFGTTDNVWNDPAPANDTRALQDPRGAAYPRAIGCAYASMSFAVDVSLSGSTPPPGVGGWYQLAAYIVDYDYSRPTHTPDSKRRVILTTLDGQWLNPAVPVQYINDYVSGVWIVIQVNTSIRLRFSQLAGDNAVVSAIMFDEVQQQQG